MSITPNLSVPTLFYQNPIDAFQTYNGSTNVYGVPTELTSCRNCNANLAGNDPASQYQRQKLIQHTVSVYAALYTANLGPLTAYKKPLDNYQLVEQNGAYYPAPPRVCWNQMSDRPMPSVQVVKTGSGSIYGASSTKHTIVRNRPHALSPGGVGVDIKHNSYDRYLNRLKGKAPMRRGTVPPYYGAPIPFNRAYPVYGGKTVKTAIVNNCDCPIDNNVVDTKANDLIYGAPSSALQDQILKVGYKFNVGDFVLARKIDATATLYKAKILSIVNGQYTIQFVDDETVITTSAANLLIYYACNCTFNGSLEEYILANQFGPRSTSQYFDSVNNVFCNILNKVATNRLL